MEGIADTTSVIVNGDLKNILVILGFVLIVILLFFFFAKKGFFSVKSSVITVGNNELERKIIRQQMEYCKAELDSYFAEIIRVNQNNEKFDEMKCLYSKELVFDILIEAIYLNHITIDEFYVESKVIKIWAKLSKLKLGKNFCTDDFKDKCYKEVEKIIKRFYDIRKYYSKPQLFV